MKYLCLVYHDEEELDALSEREYRGLVAESVREELFQSGHYITSAPLQPSHTATTIRVYHGEVSIIDGPFAETKAPLSGFYVIAARDLNDAIRAAAKLPSARVGYVEVRPIKEQDAIVPCREPAPHRYECGQSSLE